MIAVLDRGAIARPGATRQAELAHFATVCHFQEETMISAILTKIKQWARWVYDWITVITASLVGLPTLLIQLLNYFGTIDLSPLIGPDMALKVVTGWPLQRLRWPLSRAG